MTAIVLDLLNEILDQSDELKFHHPPKHIFQKIPLNPGSLSLSLCVYRVIHVR
jgi:hypothetical protein